MSIPHSRIRQLGLALAIAGAVTIATPPSFLTMPARAAETAALSSLGSSDDFATQTLGEPWDMSSAQNIALEYTRDNGNFSGMSFENGLLSGTSTALQAGAVTYGDAHVFLQVPSDPALNPVPGEGGAQPINADVYRYLTVRLYVPGTTNTGDAVQVFWQAAMNGALGSTQTTPGTLFREGWNTVTFDLKSTASSGAIPGTSMVWQPWAGQIQMLRIDPTVRPNVPFKLDFVLLSTTPPTPINITLAANSGDLMMTRAGADDAERVIRNFSGSYDWNTRLAAGAYEFYSTSDPSTRETLTINATPKFEITAPSYISGPDFATEMRGTPWNMDSAASYESVAGLSSTSFANGIFSGVNRDFTPDKVSCGADPRTGQIVYCGDPEVTMHRNESRRIDTSRYKYLTYRMKLNGNIDTVYGSVARVLWVNDEFDTGSSTSLSWVVYEGWQTVSFDLNKIKLEAANAKVPGLNKPWSQSTPYVLRFDPHEFAAPRQFDIDYLLLTGDDRANASFDIRYNLSDGDSPSAAVQFFYTPTQGATSGGTAISCAATAAVGDPQQGSRKVFLPMMSVLGPSKPVSPEGISCRWDTAKIPAGTYYIYGVANDSINSRSVASKTAVIVSH